MRERQIHPAVFIEVESHHADGWRQLFFVELDAAERREFPFARIEVDGSSLRSSRDHEVHRAVIIKISGDHARARGCNAQRRFHGHICKCAIPIVAPKNIVRRPARRSRIGRHGDVQIQVAIVVVVHERQAHAAFVPPDSNLLRHINKFPISTVAQQPHAVAQTNRQIGVAVIIEIARRATEAAAG